MAFTLILLTVYPEYQTRLQEELDHQLADKTERSVQQAYQALRNDLTGAVPKEFLRLYCIVQFLLRTTVTPTTVLDSKGQTHVILKGKSCLLNFSAAFLNPKFDIRSHPDGGPSYMTLLR